MALAGHIVGLTDLIREIDRATDIKISSGAGGSIGGGSELQTPASTPILFPLEKETHRY